MAVAQLADVAGAARNAGEKWNEGDFQLFGSTIALS